MSDWTMKTPSTKVRGTYKLHAIVPLKSLTLGIWFLTVYKIIFSWSLTSCNLPWWLVAYFFSFLGEKTIENMGHLQLLIKFHFEINALIPLCVEALSLPLGCQGALASAGQVFSFLDASSFGPPLLSCSGRSWPQQMLNTAGVFLRPRCRGGQGHCPKPLEEVGKYAMKWHFIIFFIIHSNMTEFQ